MSNSYADYKMLVVDDHEISLKLLSKQLEGLGFRHIDTARNGEEGLRMLEHNTYDIVAFDWAMPVMDGEMFLTRCRSNPRLNTVGFIMISSEAQKDSILTIMSKGATSYLTKPVVMEDLKRNIDQVIVWIDRHKKVHQAQ